MHYYQFNIGDYASHTAHLEPLEDIAYRRMIDWCYLHELPLPDDIEKIAKLIRMREQCTCIADVLQEFFTLDADGYHCFRIDKELAQYKSLSDKRKKAANKRWATDSKASKGDASALQVKSKSNANHKPLTINQEPLTKVRRFAPPALQEVLEYCAQRKNFVDPHRFIDHYTSNGWKVGKNQMKDWKAAVRTWEKSSKQESDKPKNQTPLGRALSDAEQLQAYYANEQASDSYVGQNESTISTQVGGSGGFIDGEWETQPKLPNMVRSNGGFD